LAASLWSESSELVTRDVVHRQTVDA